MIRFKIYKNPSGVWLHQQIGANGFLYKPFILGKFAVKFDGDYMKLNEEGGSRRFYDDPTNAGMRYDEVQIFVNGVGETFGSVQALAARLRDLFYPGFDYVMSGEGLQMVTTENTSTVTFTGNGTVDNPLMAVAVAVGGGSAVFPTGFVTVNPILRTGDTFTFQAGETYNLDNNPETLIADFVTTIATEDEGISRIDVIYALPGGTYGKSVGTPGEIAQKPDIPDGALERTQFNISGDVAEDTVVIVPQVGNIQNVLLEGSYTDQTYNHVGSGYSINSPNGTSRSRNFMIANGSSPGGFIFGGGGENSSGTSSAGIMRVGSGFRDLGMRLNGQLFYNAFTKTEFEGREIPDVDFVQEMIDNGGGGGGSTGQISIVSQNGNRQNFIPTDDTNIARGIALLSAKTAAASGDVIFVYPGVYDTYDLAKNGVNYHFYSGAKVEYTGDVADARIFSDGGNAVVMDVSGDGEFVNIGTGGGNDVIFIANAGTKFSIRCSNIYASPNRAIENNRGVLTIWAKEIKSTDGTVDLTDPTGQSVTTVYADVIISENSFAIENDGGKCFIYANKIIATNNTAIVNPGGAGLSESTIFAAEIHGNYGVEVSTESSRVKISGAKFFSQTHDYYVPHENTLFLDNCITDNYSTTLDRSAESVEAVYLSSPNLYTKTETDALIAAAETAANTYTDNALLGNITPNSINTNELSIGTEGQIEFYSTGGFFAGGGNFSVDPDGNVDAPNLYNKTETDALLADKVAQTITNGVTTSAPSQDAVFDALVLKADANNVVVSVAGLNGTITTEDLRAALGVSTDVTKDLVSDHTDKVSTTGISTQQVLSSVAIGQATGIRTIKPDSFLNVRTRFSKSANQNAADIKFYISTVAGTPGSALPAGAVHIGRYSMSAATLNVSGWQREYNINASSLLEGMNANLSGLTDIMIGNSNPIAVQLSLPQQYYFITTVEMASPAVETLTQKSIHITSSK